MNKAREAESGRISRQFKDLLNKMGYSFQYSVINELLRISTKWKLYGSEIPVSTRGKTTHIDFVFRDASSFFYLVGECKRVQPHFADWVFVKTPYSFGMDDRQPSPLIFDNLQETRGGEASKGKKVITPYSRNTTSDIYGLGFKIKKHLKENEVECQDSIDAINDSVWQVLRATSGFINLLFQVVRESNYISYDFDYYFLPVIFTTAKLWVTNANIGEADLAVGNLSEIQTVEEVPYLWFNYNRPYELSPDFKEFIYNYNDSSDIKNQAPRDSFLKEDTDYGKLGFEFEDFTRSVLIINSSHLKEIDLFDRSLLGI